LTCVEKAWLANLLPWPVLNVSDLLCFDHTCPIAGRQKEISIMVDNFPASILRINQSTAAERKIKPLCLEPFCMVPAPLSVYRLSSFRPPQASEEENLHLTGERYLSELARIIPATHYQSCRTRTSKVTSRHPRVTLIEYPSAPRLYKAVSGSLPAIFETRCMREKICRYKK